MQRKSSSSIAVSLFRQLQTDEVVPTNRHGAAPFHGIRRLVDRVTNRPGQIDRHQWTGVGRVPEHLWSTRYMWSFETSPY
jgi:hypothetical protein